MRFALPLAAALIGLAAAVPADPQPDSADGRHHRRGQCTPAQYQAQLKPKLSAGATLSSDPNSQPRWSDYNPPQPGTVVNPGTEADVAAAVQVAVKCGLHYLAQAGGHGWIDNFHLDSSGVLINLRTLKSVTFNADKSQATVQGGAIISDVVDAAWAANAQVLTGGCNCVGFMGATLGGGYGNLMGLYGLSVDQVLSMNVVLPGGQPVTVTPANADLWFAMLGAGPNFGIVTSAKIKSYAVPQAQNTAWLGGLFYTQDKIEALVQAIQDLTLQPKMSLFLYFATSGPPTNTPVVLATPFYYGSEADGRAAFKSILDIGPFNDTTAVLPYNHWNDAADGFCTKGQRKPSGGVGFQRMVPSTWRAIWNSYTQWLQNPNTGFSSVLVECYSLQKAQQIGSSGKSFPNRDIRFNGVIIPWYADASLDAKAIAFSHQVRDLWRATDDLPSNRTYINFAFGEESKPVVYGSSTSRLQQLRWKYDPLNYLNQWFDL